MKIKYYLALAIMNFRHRRLRSFLTILGIIIGVTSVVALISIGKGMQVGVEQVFEGIGENTIIVMSGVGTSFMSSLSSISSKEALTDKDMRVIKQIQGVKKVVPMLYLPDTIIYRDHRLGIYVAGISPSNIDVFYNKKGYNILFGRSLKEGDKYDVVIGYDLYDKEHIHLGDKIVLGGHKFKCVGIAQKIGDKLDDNTITIPFDVFKQLYSVGNKLSYIYVVSDEGVNEKALAERIKEVLRREKGEKKGEETFEVLSSEQLLNAVSNILGILNIVVVGIASISILVGGVGIMNTMYTAILERTKEIGIYKAIGMKRIDILLIFILESGLLGLFGGIIGVILGLGISWITVYFAHTQAGISYLVAYSGWDLIFYSLLFSFFLGVLAGLIPAKQASDLNVVDALRWE